MEVRTLASYTQAMRKVFTEAQRTVQCHQRCCDALRRLLSKHENTWDEFFVCVARILVFGTRRNSDVERLVQFVALAAVSVSVSTSSVDRSIDGKDRRGGGSSSSLANDAGGASLLERTVEFLLEHSGAADKGVRFRCCQLLGCLTTEFSQIQGMEEEHLDRVVRVLLPRLQDKEWRVREQAVVALRPFQFGLEGNDDEGGEGEEALLKEDRVREGLIGSMTSDSQPHVRQAALAAVTKTVGIIDQLMLRTQDVDERVRKAAFRTLGEDVASKLLQPHQMLTLVKRGLADKPSVADACRFMLCARWLKEVEYDAVELLKRVDVLQVEHVHLQKVPEALAKEIVRLGLRASRERGDPSLGLGFTLEDAKGLRNAAGRRVHLGIIPSSPPSKGMEDYVAAASDGPCRPFPEEALFARLQAEVVKEDKEMSAVERETRLETIMPDTTSLCEQIALKLGEVKELLDGVEEQQQQHQGQGQEEGIAEEIEMRIESDVFVLQQLLMLAAHADFSEEAGRRRLVILLQGLLVDVNMTCQLVESTMNALSAAHSSEADFVRVVAELVSDIWDLVHTRQIQNASVNTSLDVPFASALSGGGGGGVTPERSAPAVMESGVRAAIPKNIVRDRARAIEGFSVMEGVQERECGGARQAVETSLEDEFMDARSHHTSDQGLRQAAVGNDNSNGNIHAHGADEDVDHASSDMRRMFRILDMLSAILTKTKQTLARDATLRAFDEVIMDIFDWSARVLPSLCLDVRGYGPELLMAVMTVRGKYSLLGDADTAAKLHGPFFLKIARDEENWVGVRISALQALSDLSLIFRTTTFPAVDTDVSVEGDVLGLLADILSNRAADRTLLAVTAEIVARFLFAEITHDPELLARLFIMYFEKGSAADPRSSTVASSEDEREGEEGDDGEVEEDARTVGGSLRLSQILSVYFSALPYQALRPKVRDMLSESMRHVLHILREVAELNAAAEAKYDTLYRDEEGGIAFIEVPVQEVVGMVWRLLEKAASLGPSDDSSKSSEAASPNVEGAETETKVEPCDADQYGQVGDAVEAAGHAALCITEELWTLGGVDGVSDLVESLAKVLKSLALPEDQTTLKRLRNNVDRLEALGDRQLGSKVSKIIEKYAQVQRLKWGRAFTVLLDADLTPYEGVGSDGRADREAEDGMDGSQEEIESSSVATGKAAAAPKKSAKARRSKEPAPASCGRPTRQSKMVARVRMANAEAAAAALEVADSGSDKDDTMNAGSDGVTKEALEGEYEESGTREETVEEGNGARRGFSTRGKGLGRSRTAKSTGRPALSEIVSNSPEARRQSR